MASLDQVEDGSTNPWADEPQDDELQSLSDLAEFEAFDADEDDSGIPRNPFAFQRGIEEFIADDVDEYGIEGDVEIAPPPDATTPSIDEGDFLDPAQRFLFKRLKNHIRHACNVNSKANERSRAIDWIFVPSTRDSDSLEFEPVCRALGARPMIVRARVMHQFWKANIMLNEPLPFLASIPPPPLMSEVSSLVGPGLPLEMAREIWYWPSIPGEVLRAKFSEVASLAYQAALASLEANGYIAMAFGRIYFISRNPTIMDVRVRNRFTFAGSIYGDY
jgi:hypothetical protein